MKTAEQTVTTTPHPKFTDIPECAILFSSELCKNLRVQTASYFLKLKPFPVNTNVITLRVNAQQFLV